MLTQLDVINQCLASMALAPISSPEIASNPYAQSAQARLLQVTTDTLAKGWWFNERLLTTDPLPADLLRVEGNFGRTLSWRGSLGIYDHTRSAYIAAPYPAKTLGYVMIQFPDLPPPLQAYIAALTVVAFQAEFDGSDAKAKQHAGEVARTLNVVQEIDRNSRTNWRRFWELLSKGWWFNTVETSITTGAAPALPPLTLSVQGPPQRPLYLDGVTGSLSTSWTGQDPGETVHRCRVTVQVPPESLPATAAEWLRRASALDAERESLSPDPRVLAELNELTDQCYGALRRENSERIILREQSREFQSRGWWFNTLPLENCVIDDGALVAAFVSNVNTGLIPFSVNFEDRSTGGADRWLWDFGDGTTSSLKNPTKVYPNAGSYTVTLRAYRRRETALSTPFVITAQAPLGTLSVDFTANVLVGPSPLTVAFTGSSVGGADGWAWDFENNGSIDSTVQNPTTVYTTSVPQNFTPRLVGTRSADAATDTEAKAGAVQVTRVVNLNAGGGANVGTTSAVGVTVTGLDPLAQYELTKPLGQSFAGWSGWPTDISAPGGLAWTNQLIVTRGSGPAVGTGDGRSTVYGSDGHLTSEAARAAWVPVVITGSDQYTFWMYDPFPVDDRGGSSIQIRRLP